MCRCPKSSHGFTLIELLVGLAILSILAGILLPVVGRVRGEAQLAQAVSRIRSVGTATSLYVQDNDGKMPLSDSASQGRWPFKVGPYLEAKDTIQSNEMYQNPIFRDPTQEEYLGQGRGIFGYNLFFTGLIDDQYWRHYNNIQNPGNLPLFATTNGDDGGGLHMAYTGPHSSAKQYGYSGRTDPRGPAPNLNGRTVYLMGDFSTFVADDQWPWSDNQGSDFHPKGDLSITRDRPAAGEN